MLTLIVGLILFFTLHSLVIFAPRWREKKRQRWGRGAWRWIYSIGSLITVGLIAWGYSQARLSPTVLYLPPAWAKHATGLLMFGVFPLLYATFLPSRVRRTLRYPDLVAIKLWAVAHLLANGMLADVLLFGSFLAWAVINRISLKRRVRIVPSGAPSEFNDLVAIIAGLVTYLLVLFFLHYKVIGVAPF
ncbi:MAG: NnrU family protein [Steroidobacteraceae bacterium]